jgi:hypothetical protein
MIAVMENKVTHNHLNSSELKLINLFYIGVLFHSLGYVLPFSEWFNYQLCNLLQLIGIALFLPSTFLLLNLKINNIFFRFILFSYVTYLATVVYRGLTTDYSMIKFMLFDSWFGGFLYLVPLVSLFPFLAAKKLFPAITVFSVLFLLLSLIFTPLLIARGTQFSVALTEMLSRTIAIPAGLILITYPYHKMHTKLIAVATIVVVLILSIYHGRRGLMIYQLIIVMIAFLVYLSVGKNRMFILVLLAMLVSSALLFGAQVLNKSSLFAYILDRGLEDTRSNVEIRFFEDMEGWDWIVGRGMLGQYYCPGIIWDGEPSVYRDVIETDFLQIILKGGLISLALLMLALIPAVFLGLFKSNNLLAKAGSVWILFGILNMYPATVNTFTLNYILMWLFVGFIYNRSFRSFSNQQIFSLLNDSNTNLKAQDSVR